MGDQWDSATKGLSFNIKLPNNLKPKATLVPSWLKSTLVVKPGQVSVQVGNIPKKQTVDLLLTFSKNSLTGQVTNKSGLAPTLPSSNKLFIQDSTTRVIVLGLAFVLLIILPTLLWFLFWQKKKADGQYKGDRLLYAPPEGPLIYGYALSEESSNLWKGLEPATAMIVTLLDLVARGYYQRENVRDHKTGDWRLLIAVKKDRPKEELSQGELEVLKYFDRLLKDGPVVLDNLDSRLKKGEAALSRQRIVIAALKNEILKGTERQNTRSSAGFVKGVAIIWVLVFTLFLGFFFTPTSLISDLFAFLTLLSFTLFVFAIIKWPMADLSKISDFDMKTVGPWRAYREFVTSFPKMNQAPDLQVILWERAFAAALMYGVAKEFVERIKVVVPELPESSLAFADSAYIGILIGSNLVSAATPPGQAIDPSAISAASGIAGGISGGFGGGGFGGGGGGSW